MLLVPPAATQAQSMIDPPPCLAVAEVLFSGNSAPFSPQTHRMYELLMLAYGRGAIDIFIYS